MAKIKQIFAREILDSRGNPTIETTVILNDNSTGVASCPSGSSIGANEAVELRDGDESRHHGMGVLKAIENVNKVIAPQIINSEASQQHEVDRKMIELDGTQNKIRLGANAILSVSMALAKASAKSSVLPLFLYLRQFIKRDGHEVKIPTPIFNVINGGKHASSGLDFQEFHIIPATSRTYSQALYIGVSVYHSLKEVLINNNVSTLVGDEGGYGPNLAVNKDVFPLLKQAVENSNLRFGSDVFFGIDAAANSFKREQEYFIKDHPSGLNADGLIAYYQEINKDYRLLYIEDPLAEDDWDSWQKLTSILSNESLIVGDDLTVTNPYRLQMALTKKAITGIVIKPNQIGTVIEALAVVEVAREMGLKIIVSHRSGETNDDFIADFAVAVSSDYVKFGAPARGERVAKYNRLLHIETQLAGFNAKGI